MFSRMRSFTSAGSMAPPLATATAAAARRARPAQAERRLARRARSVLPSPSCRLPRPAPGWRLRGAQRAIAGRGDEPAPREHSGAQPRWGPAPLRRELRSRERREGRRERASGAARPGPATGPPRPGCRNQPSAAERPRAEPNEAEQNRTGTEGAERSPTRPSPARPTRAEWSRTQPAPNGPCRRSGGTLVTPQGDREGRWWWISHEPLRGDGVGDS